MASRNRSDDLTLVPDQPTGAGYEQDLYAWTKEQAQLVREGRWSAVDRDNVAEEMKSLGRTEFNKLESALRVLLLHALEWDHQPGKRTRSWVLSIAAQRLEIENLLADSASLRPRVAEAITRAYRKARIEAAQETVLDETVFPAVCGYSFDDVMTRRFSL